VSIVVILFHEIETVRGVKKGSFFNPESLTPHGFRRTELLQTMLMLLNKTSVMYWFKNWYLILLYIYTFESSKHKCILLNQYDISTFLSLGKFCLHLLTLMLF